jgi:hypothetical protein
MVKDVPGDDSAFHDSALLIQGTRKTAKTEEIKRRLQGNYT